MKKKYLFLLIVIFSCFSANSIFSQRDPATLHVIIKGHMKNSDLLSNRGTTGTGRLFSAERIKKATEEYTKIEKEVKKKISIGYHGLEYSFEMAKIVGEMRRTPKLLSEYYNFVIENGTEHPLILKYYYSSIKGIEEELITAKKILAGGVVIFTSKKNKHDTLIYLGQNLENINRLLEGALFMGRGVVGLNLKYKESFIEIMKSPEMKREIKNISDNVINKMSK